MYYSQNLFLRQETGPATRYLRTRQFYGPFAAFRCKLVDYVRKAASFRLQAASFYSFQTAGGWLSQRLRPDSRNMGQGREKATDGMAVAGVDGKTVPEMDFRDGR